MTDPDTVTETQRIVMHEQGAAEVMQLETAPLDAPGPGEVQIVQDAIGLNFMDVYQRSGTYTMSLPSPLGLEGAGRVIAIGEGVSDFSVGDAVAYGPVLGAYARHRNLPAARTVKLPEGIDARTAAAVLMKGTTVHYLLTRTYKVQPGDDVLFWAASGGVGQIAGQWGKALGARMIGVTAGAESCARLLRLGYAHAIDRKTEDVAARVREITGGKGVQVVYDSVGKASFDASLQSLGRYGMFVSFGATTGEAPAVTPGQLQYNGSLYFTRPTLADYIAERSDLVAAAEAIFDMVASGAIAVNIDQTYPLADVVRAHHDLEAGRTTGSSLLLPVGTS
ncbi:quinone oxidoreductase family protein [Pseudooceanicola algae]|uniref:Quinone oxidoreductase 1 n=1 Tax=Pseudooceanicola algae TaxID=1537215 RepID=A0A418SHL0_9RHOB|nr:quinone oxidoreductase [Pseudooceanicola algae]QPM90484.1 Quinone oxidoreductase 1 [Pseudooceanicola algae]